MKSSVTISIVICTYNNADSLKITLDQIQGQQLSEPNLVELVIVNNNSPDHTEIICENFAKTAKIKTKYFFESRQGLSHARNTGVENSNGDYILFTDDDADLPTHWVQTYLEKIELHSPDCLYSKIDVTWDKPKPWWFLPEYNPCFVVLDYGNEEINITDLHKEFYGKNFSALRSLVNELGGFDPALGRNGSKLIAGEETLLYRKMIELGKKVIYFPEAPVGHRLKEREYSENNIKKLYIDSAYSMHYISNINAKKRFLGRPIRSILENLKILLKSCMLYSFYLFSINKSRRYFYFLNILKSLTFIKLWVAS